jgi:hypothetical protein
MTAVSAAVFAMSPDSIFVVQSYARNAIAASSIASGLGVTCDAWFLLRYNWAELHTFILRAQDIYGSYFFFALSSRVPALCLFISSVTLMLFLGLVAFDVWPMGVLITSFAIGIIMGLQWLVWLVHKTGVAIGKGVLGVYNGLRHVLGYNNQEQSGRVEKS